jgi:flagellar biosynthesis/type III secretory pathway protein FliH
MKWIKAPKSVQKLSKSRPENRAQVEPMVSEAGLQAQRDELEQCRAQANAWMVLARQRAIEAQERDVAEIAQLAIDVARTILGREATTSFELVREMAHKALGRVRRAQNVVLRAHPDEAADVRERCRSLLPVGVEPEGMTVESDPLVGRGGVIVESELGRVDATIETQLRAIARVLSGNSE